LLQSLPEEKMGQHSSRRTLLPVQVTVANVQCQSPSVTALIKREQEILPPAQVRWIE
jgi:hypothetical protein